jgi:hypothetical protein
MKDLARRRLWLPLAIVGVLTGALLLAAHAYMGTFSRYLADDFCTASTLRHLGFLGSQANWYQTWTGRYAYTFVVSLTQVFGPGLTPWLPATVLVAWAAAVVYAVRRLQGPKTPWMIAAAIAAIHIVGTLTGSPNVYQSLYWQTGMVTYTLPLVLAVFYGTWLWQSAAGESEPRLRSAAAGVSLVAALLLGGFSETYVALQTTALALLLLSIPLLVARPKRVRAAVVVGAGLIGSVLAGLTIALAPGTQVRRSLMPAAPELASWTEATLRDGYLFLARTVKGSPEVVLLALLVPLLLVVLLHQQEVDDTRQPVAEECPTALPASACHLILMPRRFDRMNSILPPGCPRSPQPLSRLTRQANLGTVWPFSLARRRIDLALAFGDLRDRPGLSRSTGQKQTTSRRPRLVDSVTRLRLMVGLHRVHAVHTWRAWPRSGTTRQSGSTGAWRDVRPDPWSE